MMVQLERFFRFGLKLDDKYRNERQYGARNALLVLTAMNMLNYADRYVPSAVKQLIIDDLGISDFESSLPTTGMIVTYMIFAMIFGYLSDRQLVDRRVIMWGAAIFWSVATSLAGLSRNLIQLILIRALVGVGEAAYGTISPPMLSDFYPYYERNVVYGIYYLAIPIGGAIGFAFGAVIGQSFGWRIAFVACGLPGIFAAIMILRLNDPVRGINDRPTDEVTDSPPEVPDAQLLPQRSSSTNHPGSESKQKKTLSEELIVTYHEIKQILSNRYFMFATVGLVASNFALGGLADWMATYMLRYDNVSLDAAGLVAGAATIIGGIGGTLLGSKVCAYFQTKWKNSFFLIPSLFTIPGAILLLFTINISTNSDGAFVGIVILLILSEVCIWTYLAPISAVSVSCIPPPLRARSCGLQIFLQHVLGDVISPPIIGAISDSTGSLRAGLQLAWIFVLLSGLSWFLGSRLEPFKAMADDSVAELSCVKEEPKYWQLLREDEEFEVVNGVVVRKSVRREEPAHPPRRPESEVTVNPLMVDLI